MSDAITLPTAISALEPVFSCNIIHDFQPHVFLLLPAHTGGCLLLVIYQYVTCSLRFFQPFLLPTPATAATAVAANDRVGWNNVNKCVVTLTDILSELGLDSSAPTLFFDPYVMDGENVMYPVPVVISNIQTQTPPRTPPRDQVIGERFFLYKHCDALKLLPVFKCWFRCESLVHRRC
jgi:hypothetical protein